ncbi:transient receptor potential cation channel subfamily M member 2-like [Liolophura sinensis]|uniref:transient receptor potential cation channel subfamily M member 2-like n=1 Tax=Liolophura sinensis TaxID=3198878 RepID=UPI003158D73A
MTDREVEEHVSKWVFGLSGPGEPVPMDNEAENQSPKRKKREKPVPKEPGQMLPKARPVSDTIVMAYNDDKSPKSPVVNKGESSVSRTRVTATEFDLRDFQTTPIIDQGLDTYDGPKKSAVGRQKRPSFLKSSWGKEVLADYVTTNIYQSECSYYIKNPLSKSASCKCGRTFEWHRIRGRVFHEDNDNERWDPRSHTERTPCDSFGEICFQGFGNETNNSPYLRLDSGTDLDKVWTVLTECWCLPYPTLIISVTGCSGNLNLKPRLKTVFKQGLVNAVASTGAWLLTGGTHTGVIQLVGQAVHEYRMTATSSEQEDIVALGITAWGSVANKQALEGDGDKGLFPANYSIDALTDSKRTAPLDHNHTHFLLVDDGTEKHQGREGEFRACLEGYVSGRVETGIAAEHSVNVPAVLLVVGGEQDTLKAVLESIRRRTPVVVIQGTGKAADILAGAYKLSRNPMNEDTSAFPAGFLATCMRRIQSEFHWPDDGMAVYRDAKECMKVLMEILRYRPMVNVFELDDAAVTNVDKCILYALLKANKTRPETQLALSLAWNRCDVAREQIFTYENRKHWQSVNLYDAMFTALVQDRVEFIQLFIDSGVDLKRLTVSTLWNLYASVINEPPDNCAELLKSLVSVYQQNPMICCGSSEKGETPEDLLKKIGRLLQDLLGEQFTDLYKGPQFLLSKAMSSQPWGQEDVYFEEKTKPGNPWNKGRRQIRRQEFEHPERELFLWALLLNRREMAKFFWRTGKDHIGGAIVASTLLKSLSVVAADEEEAELSETLVEHANYYGDVAVTVLSECYNKNKRMAHTLLVRELKTWGDTTLFALAQNGGLMDFMDHACCQTKLNLIWNGCIAQHTPFWKVILTIVCPILVPLVKFADNETSRAVHDNDSEEHTDSNPTALNRVMPDNGSGVQFTQSRTEQQRNRRGKNYFFQVMCCRDDLRSGLNIDFCRAMFYFYTAPVTKFYCNMIAYLIFLCLFTYFLLTDLNPMVTISSVSVAEWVTWGWVATMIMEEFRQIFVRTPKVVKYKVISWGRSFWNRYDMSMYLLLIVSIILRCTLSEKDFVWARMLYSITLTMFYLRFMQTFHAEKNIGPKVIMIKLMLTDLVFFLLILFVFVVSFGTAYHANLYPNTELSWNILKNVIYIPYWQTYGIYNLDVIEGKLDSDDCYSNSTLITSEKCPEQTWLVPVLTAIYVLLTHILLVNLLIAMFSYTFGRVQKNSEKVWSYYRFSIIFEYYDRPAFVPPLSLLVYVYRVFRYCCYGGLRQSTAFCHLLTRDAYQRYVAMERSSTEKILTRALIEQREGLDSKVTSTSDRLDRVMAELENIKEQIKVQEQGLAGALVHEETIPFGRPKPSEEQNDDAINRRLNEMQQQLSTVLSLLTRDVPVSK